MNLKDVKIEIKEACSEKEYVCERCNTSFWMGELLTGNSWSIISPCDCYKCASKEADKDTEEFVSELVESEEDFEWVFKE